jgi:hypothetical protein
MARKVRDEVEIIILSHVIRMNADRGIHVAMCRGERDCRVTRGESVAAVSIRVTPASRARASTAGMSVKEGQVRWQWVSTIGIDIGWVAAAIAASLP